MKRILVVSGDILPYPGFPTTGAASHILRILGKLLIAGSVTSVLFYATQSLLIFPINIIFMFAVYTVSLLVLNVIGHEDKQICLEIFNMAKAIFT